LPLSYDKRLIIMRGENMAKFENDDLEDRVYHDKLYYVVEYFNKDRQSAHHEVFESDGTVVPTKRKVPVAAWGGLLTGTAAETVVTVDKALESANICAEATHGTVHKVYAEDNLQAIDQVRVLCRNLYYSVGGAKPLPNVIQSKPMIRRVQTDPMISFRLTKAELQAYKEGKVTMAQLSAKHTKKGAAAKGATKVAPKPVNGGIVYHKPMNSSELMTRWGNAPQVMAAKAASVEKPAVKPLGTVITHTGQSPDEVAALIAQAAENARLAREAQANADETARQKALGKNTWKVLEDGNVKFMGATWTPDEIIPIFEKKYPKDVAALKAALNGETAEAPKPAAPAKNVLAAWGVPQKTAEAEAVPAAPAAERKTFWTPQLSTAASVEETTEVAEATPTAEEIALADLEDNDPVCQEINKAYMQGTLTVEERDSKLDARLAELQKEPTDEEVAAVAEVALAKGAEAVTAALQEAAAESEGTTVEETADSLGIDMETAATESATEEAVAVPEMSLEDFCKENYGMDWTDASAAEQEVIKAEYEEARA
jgi:hypothetical protein